MKTKKFLDDHGLNFLTENCFDLYRYFYGFSLWTIINSPGFSEPKPDAKIFCGWGKFIHHADNQF